MAFRLREDESVAKGLRRVVRKELRSASERLTSDSSDAAIHEARKSIKKVRAVLQLLGKDLAADDARKHLRRASHLLSPVRDADAMIETVKSLRSPGNPEVMKPLAALSSELHAEKARVRDEADAEHVRRRAARALERVRRDARDWRWKRTEFPLLAEAMKRSYKRARRAMENARPAEDPDAFHEWRKRVKTHWYALRLLEERVPKLRRQIGEFRRLETALGDDHNLYVLRDRVQSSRLRAIAERRQQALEQQALALGESLFARRPKAFAHHLQEIWTRASRSRAGKAA